MSAEAVVWAWQQPCTSSGDKLTLIAFAWEADSEGATFVGPKKLKVYTGLEEAGLRKCISRLAKSGLLTRFRRHRSNGSEGSAFTLLSLPRDSPFPFDHYEFVIGDRIDGPYPRAQGYPVGYPPPLSQGIPLEQELHKTKETSTKSLSVKISGNPVNVEAWHRTLEALGEFNKQTGKSLGALTGRGAPSENAKRIYMRLRDWPDLTNQDVADLIRRTLAGRWWGSDDPTVGVVFGPKVFEDNMTRTGSNGNGRKNGRIEPDYDRERAVMLAMRNS